MIVSALLTSVAINFGLCTLFITLYSILRRQPGTVSVYSPRNLREQAHEGRTYFGLDRLLPSTSWVLKAWHTSEEELLMTSGLDAVVFMHILIFSFRVFLVAGIMGIFILPVNYLGNQLHDVDFFNIPNESLDLFSISNVNDGSKRLWLHFCAVYLFTGAVCYLLYHELEYISSKRISHFDSSELQPHDFAILVRGIPSSGENKSFDDSVVSFFTEYHSSTYLSHLVVRRKSKLQNLIEVPAAFVFFKSRYGASVATHIQQSINPMQWTTEAAPEPRDVFWSFFSVSIYRRWGFKLVVIVASFFLTLGFLIPVVFVQGLTHLDQLQILLPFLKNILKKAFVSQVITGYLPSLILQIFLSIVSPLMKIFSAMQGYTSHSEIEKSACIKVLFFIIWNIFLANVLSGSVISQINLFLDPKLIPTRLAVAVPAQASFFITYVATSGWTSLSSELTRLFCLVRTFTQRLCCRNPQEELSVPSFDYHTEIPQVLFFGLLGITYFFLAPLIIPFLLVYLSLGYFIYKNQLLNVYGARFETGGKFWPIVHNCTIFSLILMHAIALGIFGLKKLPLASSLIVPLPIITLLFNEYCRKRYMPIFSAYSAETLIKKDRKDQHDPTMSEFFDNLIYAYKDSAQLSVHSLNSSISDNSHMPLLH